MKILSLKAELPAWKIWTLFFLYSLLVSLVIQLILLPYVFPSWHFGDGLLAGHDSVIYHKIAIERIKLIDLYGWRAWTLTPKGQLVSGIASFFYALITPKPWTVLPLIAAFQALGGLVLYEMIKTLSRNWKLGLAAALPFVFFPSSLMWVSQMLNESYMIPAQLIFFYGWFLLSRLENYVSIKMIAQAVAAILAGALITWAIRDFLVPILTLIALVAASVLSVALVRWVIQARLQWIRAFMVGVLIWGLCFSLVALPARDQIKSADRKANKKLNFGWNASPWLPRSLDRQVFALSVSRESYLLQWATAGSNIDTDVQFHSATDVILYLPRALQIGLFAPFPSMWFGAGSRGPNTLMRRESGLEMSLAYLLLLGLPFAMWRMRKELSWWIVLMFAVGILLIYTLVTANIGALYRFRYAYWTTILAFSFIGWQKIVDAISMWRWDRKKINTPQEPQVD